MCQFLHLHVPFTNTGSLFAPDFPVAGDLFCEPFTDLLGNSQFDTRCAIEFVMVRRILFVAYVYMHQKSNLQRINDAILQMQPLRIAMRYRCDKHIHNVYMIPPKFGASW